MIVFLHPFKMRFPRLALVLFTSFTLGATKQTASTMPIHTVPLEERRMHRPPYARLMNQIYMTLRTEPAEEAWPAICGLQGLCYKRGACSTPIELAFFWWICADKSLGFKKSPHVKQGAKQFNFHISNGMFQRKGKLLSAETYLAKHLLNPHVPQYLAYMIAKTITQAPVNSIPRSALLKRKACQKFPQLCLQSAQAKR